MAASVTNNKTDYTVLVSEPDQEEPIETVRVPIDFVQMDALVVMKLLKHCRESLPDAVMGMLLGLSVENRLEITNCWPFPSADSTVDVEQYERDIIALSKEVNMDHLQVGWYQSTYRGAVDMHSLVETHATYQKVIDESVVILYDPLRISQGTLSLRAFRLSKEFFDMYSEQTDATFTPQGLRDAAMSYDKVLTEIPILVHNPLLVNAMLCSELKMDDTDERLDVPGNSFLEKSMEFLVEGIDELASEQGKLFMFQRQVLKQKQQQQDFLRRRRAENEQRAAKGDAPLPTDPDKLASTNPLFRPLPQPSRLDALLVSHQVAQLASQVNEFAASSYGQMFVIKGLQE